MIDELKKQSEADRRSHWERYRALLRENSSDPAKVNELREVMNALGKSPADAHADSAKLIAAGNVKARIGASKGIAQRLNSVSDAVQKFPDETQRIVRERETMQFKMEEEQRQMKAQYDAATQDVELLNKLLAEHPDLLRDVKPATYADLD